ncbi:hypothetical protein [Phycicoccus sp.]|uniref:hypothetical protein n=1 Tax=Phycicoccus sp. TaxID=1902410 RepID=UPI002C85CB25|nr:hypothetical protein [Phycicoccus sp.]HMM95103.1 hypothetical protein [Phycicoccus sp.]
MRSRKHQVVLVWGVLVIGGVAAALGYYASSTALVSEPPSRGFDGWVALLQPASAVEADVQVQVTASALSRGSEPVMAYSVSMCGGDDFHGFLLVGGLARLQGAQVSGAPGGVRNLSEAELSVENMGNGTTTTYGRVQIIQIDISDLPACLASTPKDEFGGVGMRVEGTAEAPVVSVSENVFIRGAVERWSMPYVGNFPGAGQQLGVFRIEGGIRGEYIRPRSMAVAVDAGRTPLGLEVTDARPPVERADLASWRQAVPFQGTAKVRDVRRQAELQRWSVVSAIGLAVFGSIVASMIFEAVRPSAKSLESSQHVAQTSGPPAVERPQQARMRPTFVLAAIAGYVIGRLRGRLRR